VPQKITPREVFFSLFARTPEGKIGSLFEKIGLSLILWHNPCKGGSETMSRRYTSLVGLVLIVFISGVSTGVDITFQIDMRYQPDFEPPIDFVGPRGNLTPLNWHKTLILSDSSNDSIYTGTASFDDTLVGSELYYKFVFGVDSCWAVTWEVPLSTAGASRNLEIPSNDATLPVTYFSDIDRPPISMNVTIRFNLFLLF